MNQRAGGLTKFVSGTIAFVMVQALLLPLYGSWLNSQFAAIQPNHKHIYVGIADPNHPHSLSISHQHDSEKAETSDSDVISVPNQDASQSITVLFSTFDGLAALTAPDHPSLVFSLEADYLLSALVYHAPPVEPPRL